MKKSIVALAVLSAASGAAMAQSSVTLYGILDVGYQWTEGPTNVGTTAAPRIQQESVSKIQGGYQSGNRWGLRGSEDLGGGWKAIFTLESGFDIDTGMSGQGNRLFGRQAFVGVDSGLGTLVAGRLATFSSGTGSFDMFGRVDPFATGFGIAGLQSTFISANALRADNAVAYRSPKFAGFQGGIGYSTNFNGQETAPSNTNTSVFFSGINWEMGPFYAVVTYDSADYPSATGRPTQKHLQAGGVFTLGAFTLNAAYADQSNISAIQAFEVGNFIGLPAGLSNYDSTSWMAGGTWTLGAWKFMASVQWANGDGGTRIAPGGAPINFNPDYTVYGVGATYNLSRRTNLYAGYGSRNADGTLLDNTFNGKQLALGIRHLF